MTRRAFRPSVSAGACVAPVISKEAGVPWGAFGSIAVLISCFAFPALVGGARRREKTVPKRVRRSTRAVLNISSDTAAGCRLWRARKSLARGGSRRRPPLVSFPSQAARSIHSWSGAVNKYNTIYWACPFVRSNRAHMLRFYLKKATCRFVVQKTCGLPRRRGGPRSCCPAPQRRGAGRKGGGVFR